MAGKPDSQDICFVPEGNYATVIEKLRPGAAESGEIVNLAGEILGEHAGIIHFTIGQRRGLGIAASEPLYVIDVDPSSRRVTVGPKTQLMRDRVILHPPHFLVADAAIPYDEELTVRLRSTHPGTLARLTVNGTGKSELQLSQPEEATASGQAAVFYRGSRLLGGAWIAGMDRSADLKSAAA